MAVMKKILIPIIMLLVIAFAFYEESKAEKNIYFIVIAIVIFMMGMMKLSARTPSKNQDKEDENV